MAELKTKPNDLNPIDFLNAVEHEQKRKDSFVILEMMKEVTQAEPIIWGESIIGLGNYHYRYESGREGDWFLIGFSPRKQNLTLYVMSGFEGKEALIEKLGKCKTSKGCLYIKKLVDVDLTVLKEIITQSVRYLESKYKS